MDINIRKTYAFSTGIKKATYIKVAINQDKIEILSRGINTNNGTCNDARIVLSEGNILQIEQMEREEVIQYMFSLLLLLFP